MEISLQTLIKAKYSGAYNSEMPMIELFGLSIAVLIAGIVLWKASSAFHQRKKAQRSAGSRFESTFSKQWRSKG